MADQRIAYTEEMVGSGHPSKSDTVNRLALVEHNTDGTHKYDASNLPHIDVRAYATSATALVAGTEDLGAVLQAAFTANPDGGVFILPKGTLVPTTRAYIDSTSHLATFIIRGQGKGTVIRPSGFTSGYIIYVNETSGGAMALSWPRHPRCIVEDLWVNGTDSTSVSFVWFNTTSVQFKNLTFDYLLYGIKGTGYTDNITLENITWANPRTGGWLYDGSYHGDGFVGKQLFSSGSTPDIDMVSLYKCCGGLFSSCIGGHYKIKECDAIKIETAHLEFKDNNHAIEIINSHVTIENSQLRNDGATYECIHVNDDAAIEHDTVLTVRNNTFMKNLSDSSTGYREIYITNLKTTSKIYLEDNELLLGDWNSTSDPKAWDDITSMGIRLRSAIGALDTVLTNTWPIHSQNVVIYSNAGTWKCHPKDTALITTRAFSTPVISAAVTVTRPTSDLSTTTYYYRVGIANPFYSHSVASAETSIAVTNPDSVRLTVTGVSPGTMVRVLRGTSADTYIREAYIPVTGDTLVLWDTGTHVNRYVWSVGSYTHITTASAYAGTYNAITSNRVVYGSAAPTNGSWSVGDRMYDTGVTAGGYIGWVCTTAGSPGTWKTFGAVTA